MAETIAKNVSAEGPTAWLNGFEDAPDFFMASDGQLEFPNYDSATEFINNTLAKSISKIELQWSNMRIDPISDEFATFSATFHEDITDSKGQKLSQNGYFTATAHKTVQGWKLRNAHWSSIAAHQ